MNASELADNYYYAVCEYAKSDSNTVFELKDDGNGTYISSWSSTLAQPTDQDLMEITLPEVEEQKTKNCILNHHKVCIHTTAELAGITPEEGTLTFNSTTQTLQVFYNGSWV